MMVVYINGAPHLTHCLHVDDFGNLNCIGTKEAIEIFKSSAAHDFEVARETWDHAVREIGE